MSRGAGGRTRDEATGGITGARLLSRLASLGALVLSACAVGRLLLVPPAGAADLIPSLWLLVAVVHLVLLGVASWRFDEASDGERRADGRGERCVGTVGTTWLATAREPGLDAPEPHPHEAADRAKAA